ncbi:MAG: hypoxanthine phosphoribosyltransferase [Balneolales bacterium]
MALKTKSENTVYCQGERFDLYISQDDIAARIMQLAHKINRDYEGKHPIFIGILNGAFIFLADLMRQLSIECEVDFLKLSSYGDEKVSSGSVTERKELDADIAGRHVVLVEDIVDTGLSIHYIMDKLKQKKPESVSVLTLLHKKEATRHRVKLDYIGFEIPTRFVLGYGMDFAQDGRQLPHIYALSKET